MHKENYPITFNVIFIAEIRLDNFLYFYSSLCGMTLRPESDCTLKIKD